LPTVCPIECRWVPRAGCAHDALEHLSKQLMFDP
jgi:hypothetical protein